MIPGLSAGLVGSSIKSATSLYDAIAAAGLTSNLKLCLDAGDSLSYSSGQPWLDRSGGGYDFNRGATSSSSTDDPTFNGTPGGLSSNEYWSFDGGDFFQYDSSNETWMNALHKANAQWSFLLAVSPGSVVATNDLFGNTDNASPGVFFEMTTARTVRLFVKNASASSLSTPVTSMDGADAGWNIIGGSIDDSSNVGFFYLNGGYWQIAGSDTFNANYSSPAATDSTFPLRIADRGDGSRIVTNTFKYGFFAMWQGGTISKANFDTLYAALKGRYGLT